MAKRRSNITVDGKEYPVEDRMGWQSSRGVYAVEVKDGDDFRIAISRTARGPWQWSRPIVLLRPRRPDTQPENA